MSKVNYPIGIDTVKCADGKSRTALMDSKGRVLCELTFGADLTAIGDIVNRVNGNGKDTRKVAADSVDALTQAFWKDATAPTDKDASDTRRAAFKDLEREIGKAVMAYWKNTEGTR